MGDNPLMHGLENTLIDQLRSLFDAIGWLGVIIAMAVESACIPLPSEIIMPLAGWMIVNERDLGWSGILQAAFWGAIGNAIGSTIAYWVGALGGRAVLERYGRWILITHKDLDRADQWFARRGYIAVFISRLLPVVRTFISFPAGIARMPFVKFIIYTFVGAFIWCIPLTYAGYRLGPKWEDFRERARFADYPIAAIIIALIAWFIWHRVREIRREDALARQQAESEPIP